MSTGTKTYSRTYGVGAKSDMTLTFDTWSLPSGTTYNRCKVTHPKTTSGIQWTKIGGAWNSYSFATWYNSSQVAESALKYSGKAAIKLKNSNSSVYNDTWTLTIEYTNPNRTITCTAGTGGSASASPTSAGVNDTVTLTATPSTGYSFSKWTTTGGTLANANAATTTLTMPDANVTVTASFTINSYTLTTAVSPSGYGSVTAGSSMQYNSKKQLTAIAGTGRAFSSWSKTAGTLSSTTANPTTFTMGAGAATVTANFTTRSYTLTVSKGTGISSVTGGGSKAYASSNAISATASTGYTFKNWTSNNGGSFTNANAASTSFTMPAGNVTVTANATLNSYTLTVSKGTGISSVSGGGTKGYNTSNAISATASTGYTFKNWTSNNGGSFANANAASTNFTMPAGNVTVTANATINTYTLTTAVSPSGTGSVTAGASMTYNTKKQLVATAGTGYSFKNWTNTSGTLSSSTAATTTFTMGAGNATVTANFQINTYTLTTTVSPSGSGSVTAGASMTYNSKKQLVATASTGYTFSSWTKTAGTLSSTTATTTTFTIAAGNATVTANFYINTYTLTTAVSPSGGGTVTSGSQMTYGSKKQLVATASTGYTFNNWTTTSGSFSSTTATTTTFTISNANATATANFTHNTYTLATLSNPAAGGSTSGGGTKYYNDSCAISATANTGYSFINWTSNNGGTFANANAASTTYTMPNGSATLTANFNHNLYAIATISSPNNGGTITTSSASAYYNDTVTITANPTVGYKFVSWVATWNGTGGNIDSLTDNPTTITMPASDVTLTAIFEVTASSCTLDSSTYYGGDTAILTINSVSSSYTHRYKLDFGNNMTTDWVDLAAGVDSADIYIPMSWCTHLVPGTTSISGGTLILETYNGNVLLGDYTIDSLTYTALNNMIPQLSVWRCDQDGSDNITGLYGEYSCTIPSSLSTYQLEYDGTTQTISRSTVEGSIFPNNKITFPLNDNYEIILKLVNSNETFTIMRDVPMIKQVKKHVIITQL